MEFQVIKGNQIEEQGNEETKFQDLFNSDDLDISIAKVIRNSQDRTKGSDTASNNFYYVLEGEGTCITEEKEIKLEKGDLIVIPKNTKYKNIGNLRLLAISIPMFKKENQSYEGDA